MKMERTQQTIGAGCLLIVFAAGCGGSDSPASSRLGETNLRQGVGNDDSSDRVWPPQQPNFQRYFEAFANPEGGYYLMPRPDGSRTITALCASAPAVCAAPTCVTRAQLDAYGWCSGSATSSAQVDRLNRMAKADAEAIANALNASYRFEAIEHRDFDGASIEPYLPGPWILAICDANPALASGVIKGACEFERNRCSADGAGHMQCHEMARTLTFAEARVLAEQANRLAGK